MVPTARNIAFALVLLSALCVAASADRPQPLAGWYALTPNNVDPPPGAPRDSHFYINLEGDAAKALYDAMKVNPQFDSCADALKKSIGGMGCTVGDQGRPYQCHFAIHIATQKIEGVPC